MSDITEYAESCTPSKCAVLSGDDTDDRTTTCGSSVNGDDLDVLSVSDDSSSMSGLDESGYEDVKLVVKHTFVEFRCLDEDDAPKLRRTQSEPALMYAEWHPKANTWADISELEFGEESNEQLQSSHEEGIKEGSKKAARRSGRARQREKRRRQLRTPSPEMRDYYSEARTLPQLY